MKITVVSYVRAQFGKKYQSAWKTGCLCLQDDTVLSWRRRQQVPSKCWSSSTKLHGAVLEKTIILPLLPRQNSDTSCVSCTTLLGQSAENSYTSCVTNLFHVDWWIENMNRITVYFPFAVRDLENNVCNSFNHIQIEAPCFII